MSLCQWTEKIEIQTRPELAFWKMIDVSTLKRDSISKAGRERRPLLSFSCLLLLLLHLLLLLLFLLFDMHPVNKWVGTLCYKMVSLGQLITAISHGWLLFSIMIGIQLISLSAMLQIEKSVPIIYFFIVGTPCNATFILFYMLWTV